MLLLPTVVAMIASARSLEFPLGIFNGASRNQEWPEAVSFALHDGGDCWRAATGTLSEHGCGALTEYDTRARMSLALAWCHLSLAGHTQTAHLELSECTKQLQNDAVAWDTFNLFFAHADSVCARASGEHFHRRIGQSITELTEASSASAVAARQLATEIAESHDALADRFDELFGEAHEALEKSAATQQQLSQQQRHLAEQQSQMRAKQDETLDATHTLMSHVHKGAERQRELLDGQQTLSTLQQSVQQQITQQSVALEQARKDSEIAVENVVALQTELAALSLAQTAAAEAASAALDEATDRVHAALEGRMGDVLGALEHLAQLDVSTLHRHEWFRKMLFYAGWLGIAFLATSVPKAQSHRGLSFLVLVFTLLIEHLLLHLLIHDTPLEVETQISRALMQVRVTWSTRIVGAVVATALLFRTCMRPVESKKKFTFSPRSVSQAFFAHSMHVHTRGGVSSRLAAMTPRFVSVVAQHCAQAVQTYLLQHHSNGHTTGVEGTETKLQEAGSLQRAHCGDARVLYSSHVENAGADDEDSEIDSDFECEVEPPAVKQPLRRSARLRNRRRN
ncbi:MAG: hypothetical protein MHM6MM_000709 [Cercozoa sp. M6MM]